MFNGTDWLIIAILAISSLISLKRGFVKEALSLCIWLFAFLLASGLTPMVAPILSAYIEAVSLQEMAAFALIFVSTLVIGGMISYTLGTLIKMTGLSGTDRLLGILFGGLRGLILIMVLVMYLPKVASVEQDIWWQRSVLIPHFQSFEEQFRYIVASIYGEVQNVRQ